MISGSSLNQSRDNSAIVVGASLSGLMTGIALSTAGIRVAILERAGMNRLSGAALQVDSGETDSTVTARLLRKLASDGMRSAEAWSSVESRLRKQVESDPKIDLRFNTRIKHADQNEDFAWVLTDTGDVFKGDMVIGADGYRSAVRGHVSPQNAHATFAGYMIWIGIVDEVNVPEKYHPNSTPPFTMPNGIGDFLLGSYLGGTDGSWNKGKRRLAWAWYDNTQNDLLRRLGCVKDELVMRSLIGSDVPERTLKQLSVKASERWPQPWLDATLHSINTRSITGLPISEYLPENIVKGRVALVGDAAHVPTPLTASGFNASLQDAAALAECFSTGNNEWNVQRALAKYESLRLKQGQQIVLNGQSFSRSFGR